MHIPRSWSAPWWAPPIPKWGEAVSRPVVVLRDGFALSEAEAIEHCKLNLAERFQEAEGSPLQPVSASQFTRQNPEIGNTRVVLEGPRSQDLRSRYLLAQNACHHDLQHIDLTLNFRTAVAYKCSGG